MTSFTRRLLLSSVIVGGLALSACSQSAPQPEVKEVAKKEAPAPKAEPAPRDIASHVGEYPSSVTKPEDAAKADAKIDPAAPEKLTFLDNPKVTGAVFKLALPASARGVIEAPSTEVPVFKVGNMVVAHGCTPHNCATQNWTIAVSSDGGKALVCTFEAKAGETSGSAVWYDGVKPIAKRAEGCPQDAAEYSAAQAG